MRFILWLQNSLMEFSYGMEPKSTLSDECNEEFVLLGSALPYEKSISEFSQRILSI
jgi:hypothetical protein